MHRALAIAVLVALAAGPISRVVCGLDCAQQTGEVSATEECHGQRGAEPSFSVGVDHCDGSGLPVVLRAKLGDGLTAPSLGLTSVQLVPAAELNKWTLPSSGDSATAPPTNRLIPLRI